MPDFPELSGDLTRLRAWQPGDAAALAAAWKDPLTARRLAVPSAAEESAARRWIEQRERAWAERCSLDLAVADPASNAVIGEVGFSRFDASRRAALAGWWIAAGWRGRGRAGEAVRLALDWALGSGLLHAVLAEIDADNEASAAVARRAGMRPVDAPHPDPAKAGVLVFARTP